MNCVVCSSDKTRKLTDVYPGYDEGDMYSIYACNDCILHFAAPYRVPAGIYERMHAHNAASVYNVLFERAKRALRANDPFAFLLNDTHSYYPVAKAIEGKKNLKILEIGSSNGYLVHALRSRGHDAFGIDLSANAVNFAKTHFGDHYMNATLDDYMRVQPTARFDLIIALEVIEHLTDVPTFVSHCLSLLNPGGAFVFTTPNRDYFPEKSIWCNDQPPVHLLWFSPRTFQVLAQNLNADIQFVDFKDHVSSGDAVNELVAHFVRKKTESFPSYHFDREGNPYRESSQPRLHRSIKSTVKNAAKKGIKRFARAVLIDNKPVRFLSNKLYRRFLYSGINDFATIGGIFTSRQK